MSLRKVTAEDVVEMCALSDAGNSKKSIAEIYRISWGYTYRLIRESKSSYAAHAQDEQ